MDTYKSFVHRALLVDDCDTDNFIHKNYLLTSRFANEVVVKKNCLEALEYLKSLENAIEFFPDVIFLDLNMPFQNGFYFIEQFQSFLASIKSKCKIIIVTTSEDQSDIDKISNHPHIVDCLFKPMTKTSLEKIKKKLAPEITI